eukprot:6022860-Prymnesium_polylepis.1
MHVPPCAALRGAPNTAWPKHTVVRSGLVSSPTASSSASAAVGRAAPLRTPSANASAVGQGGWGATEALRGTNRRARLVSLLIKVSSSVGSSRRSCATSCSAIGCAR